MAILLVAEHDNATLSDQTAKALSAAAKIGGDVHILVAGKGAKPAAEAAAKSCPTIAEHVIGKSKSRTQIRKVRLNAAAGPPLWGGRPPPRADRTFRWGDPRHGASEAAYPTA